MGLLVATLVLSSVELSLRLLFGPPPPPVRVLGVLDADHSYWVEEGRFLAPAWRSESSGRGDGPDMASDAWIPCQVGRARTLVLGGSSVHGGAASVRSAAEFPAVLRRRLGLPVLNLGYPAMDSHDLVAVLEGFGACDASVVVAYTGHNDLGNIVFNERYGDVGSAVVARAQGVLSHSQLYVQLSRALRAPLGRASDRRQLETEPVLSPERVARARSDFQRNMERLAWLTGAHDRQLILVGAASVDRAADSATSGWRTMLADEQTHLAMARVADRHPHVSFVNALTGLPAAGPGGGPSPDLFVDPIHFSRAGHIAVADLLFPTLAAYLHVPEGGERGARERAARPGGH